MRARLTNDNVLVEFARDQSNVPENCRRAEVVVAGPWLEDILSYGDHVLTLRSAWPISEVGDRIVVKVADIVAKIESDEKEP